MAKKGLKIPSKSDSGAKKWLKNRVYRPGEGKNLRKRVQKGVKICAFCLSGAYRKILKFSIFIDILNFNKFRLFYAFYSFYSFYRGLPCKPPENAIFDSFLVILLSKNITFCFFIKIVWVFYGFFIENYKFL